MLSMREITTKYTHPKIVNLGFGSAAVEPLLLSDTSLTPLLGGIHLNDSGKVDEGVGYKLKL